MENPIKMDDLGGTPIFGNIHKYNHNGHVDTMTTTSGHLKKRALEQPVRKLLLSGGIVRHLEWKHYPETGV